MEVTRGWRPDGDDGQWASVRVAALRPLPRPVPLADIKAEKRLAGMMMLRQSRLSVSKVEPAEWDVLMEMGGAAEAGAA